MSTAETSPIALTQRLISTAVNEALTYSHRVHAAQLLIDMCDKSNSIDIAYPTIKSQHPTSLPYFRRSAIVLVAFNAYKTTFHNAGIQLMKKLVRLWLLQNNDDDRWDELLQFLQGALVNYTLKVLHSILGVFCDLDANDDLRPRFAAFLEPTLRENSLQFHTFMLDLLRRGDLKAFKILPYFYRIFDHREHRTKLMKEAIMSTLFDCDDDSCLEIKAALRGVKQCIEDGPDFIFSPAMISRINRIILRLYGDDMSWVPGAKKLAQQLVIVISRRLEWLVPFNRRRIRCSMRRLS